MREALRELGVDFDEIARAGARRRARQWRPRPPCRLLHGEHGDARRRRLRLRHPLRPRPVPPGDPGWLAGRDCPETGSTFGNPWEFERLGGRLSRSASAAASSPVQGGGRLSARLAAGRARARRRLRHAGGRLARPLGQHAAPVVGARARSDAARRLQPRRPCRRAAPSSSRRRASRASSIPTTRHAGRPGAAAAAGVLLLLRLAAGPRAPAPAASTATCATAARARRRSSSTTPIRRSPSPS